MKYLSVIILGTLQYGYWTNIDDMLMDSGVLGLTAATVILQGATIMYIYWSYLDWKRSKEAKND